MPISFDACLIMYTVLTFSLSQLDVGIGDIGSFLLSSIPASLTGRVVHLSALTEEEQCTPLEIRTFTRSGVMHTGTASHCGDSCDHACAPTSPPYLGSLRKGLREECHTRHRRTYSYMASKSGVRQISTLHAHSRHGEVTGNSNVRKAGREMLSDGYISAGHAIVSRFSFLQTVMGLGIGRGHGQGIGFPSWCLQLNDITVGALTSVSSSTPSPSLSSPSLSSPEPNSISSIDPFLHYTYPQLRTVPPSHISCPASSAHSPASSISYHAAEGHQHVYCEDHHDQECFGDPPSHHHRHTEHMFADEPFFQAQPLPLPPPPPPPIMKSLRISGLMPPFLFGLSGKLIILVLTCVRARKEEPQGFPVS